MGNNFNISQNIAASDKYLMTWAFRISMHNVSGLYNLKLINYWWVISRKKNNKDLLVTWTLSRKQRRKLCWTTCIRKIFTKVKEGSCPNMVWNSHTFHNAYFYVLWGWYRKGKEGWWYLSNAIQRYYTCKRNVFWECVLLLCQNYIWFFCVE